jgi:hypothetical protein
LRYRSCGRRDEARIPDDERRLKILSLSQTRLPDVITLAPGLVLTKFITESSYAAFGYGDCRVLSFYCYSGPGTTPRPHPINCQRNAAKAFRCVYAAETPIIEREGVNIDSAKFKDFVGEYEIAPDLFGVVALEGNKLTLFSKGWRKPFELVPLSENKFFVRSLRRRQSPSFAMRMARSLTTPASRPGSQQ